MIITGQNESRESPQTVVNFVHRFLFENIRNLLLFLVGQLALGELHVEGHVQGAEQVVVVVIGHSLALLANPGPGPRDLVSGHVHFVSVQVLDVQLEADQGVGQGDGHVGVKVIAFAFEFGVRIGFDADDQIAGFSVQMGFTFGHEFGLHAVGHPGLDLDLEQVFLGYESATNALLFLVF